MRGDRKQGFRCCLNKTCLQVKPVQIPTGFNSGLHLASNYYTCVVTCTKKPPRRKDRHWKRVHAVGSFLPATWYDGVVHVAAAQNRHRYRIFAGGCAARVDTRVGVPCSIQNGRAKASSCLGRMCRRPCDPRGRVWFVARLALHRMLQGTPQR